MGDTWIIDMRHYLDASGRIPDLPGAAMRLAQYFGSIVESVTSCFPDGTPSRKVRCRRRPGRRRCEGEIQAIIDAPTQEVRWACPLCRDNGVIHNWQGTPWDLSPDRTRSAGLGRTIERPKPQGYEDNTAPNFTARAARLWEELDSRTRIRLLNNVWCPNCSVRSSMQLLGGRVAGGDLVLNGRCLACGGDVARLVEMET